MKFNQIHISKKGFTLIEIIISITIFAMMSAMTMLIYFNVSESARRLQLSREITETAREITERIASDIRKWGISFSGSEFSSAYPAWKNNYLDAYSNNGSEVLPIGWSGSVIEKYYIYGKQNETGFAPCSEADKANVRTHCGLYLIRDVTNLSDGYNLVDSFQIEDSKKRVRIRDLKFYISGEENDARKVTLKMTLELAWWIGVPQSLIRATKTEIQSTFSQRFYKLQ